MLKNKKYNGQDLCHATVNNLKPNNKMLKLMKYSYLEENTIIN